MAGWTTPKTFQQMQEESNKIFAGVFNAVKANPDSSAGQKADVEGWAKQYNIEPFYDIEPSTRDPKKDYKVQGEKSDIQKTLEAAYDYDLIYGKNSGQSPTQTALNQEPGNWFTKAVSNVGVVFAGLLLLALAFFVSDAGKSAISKMRGG